MTVVSAESPPSAAPADAPPLLRMVRETPTAYWNDSCSTSDLEYAIARGATGATSNPTIVLDVLRKESDRWTPRIRALAALNPSWTEDDLTWAIVEEIGASAAAMLRPTFEATHGEKGRLSLQTNPASYRSAERMLAQGQRFASLAPNIQVKFPATKAGIEAIERATRAGIQINATVSFSVAQAVAVGEAVERALEARVAAGEDVAGMTPACTIMIGRLEDHLRALVDRDGIAVHPDALDWAGVATFKRAVEVYRERGFRTRLLVAAIRHRLHWTELVGGDVIMTLPHSWQVRFNASGIAPEARIDRPVDRALIEDLLARIPDFRRAYEPDGMSIDEFDGFGATRRTLRTFVQAYHDLVGAVRDVLLPDPDARPDLGATSPGAA